MDRALGYPMGTRGICQLVATRTAGLNSTANCQPPAEQTAAWWRRYSPSPEVPVAAAMAARERRTPAHRDVVLVYGTGNGALPGTVMDLLWCLRMSCKQSTIR